MHSDSPQIQEYSADYSPTETFMVPLGVSLAITLLDIPPWAFLGIAFIELRIYALGTRDTRKDVSEQFLLNAKAPVTAGKVVWSFNRHSTPPTSPAFQRSHIFSFTFGNSTHIWNRLVIFKCAPQTPKAFTEIQIREPRLNVYSNLTDLKGMINWSQ